MNNNNNTIFSNNQSNNQSNNEYNNNSNEENTINELFEILLTSPNNNNQNNNNNNDNNLTLDLSNNDEFKNIVKYFLQFHKKIKSLSDIQKETLKRNIRKIIDDLNDLIMLQTESTEDYEELHNLFTSLFEELYPVQNQEGGKKKRKTRKQKQKRKQKKTRQGLLSRLVSTTRRTKH
jgi:hypothetical protein